MERKTLELFEAYDWPGNIRELQNVVERAVILSDGETFAVDESWFAKGSKLPIGPTIPFADEVAQHEKELIEAALKESNGRISGPAGAGRGAAHQRSGGAAECASRFATVRDTHRAQRHRTAGAGDTTSHSGPGRRGPDGRPGQHR